MERGTPSLPPSPCSGGGRSGHCAPATAGAQRRHWQIAGSLAVAAQGPGWMLLRWIRRLTGGSCGRLRRLQGGQAGGGRDSSREKGARAREGWEFGSCHSKVTVHADSNTRVQVPRLRQPGFPYNNLKMQIILALSKSSLQRILSLL